MVTLELTTREKSLVEMLLNRARMGLVENESDGKFYSEALKVCLPLEQVDMLDKILMRLFEEGI